MKALVAAGRVLSVYPHHSKSFYIYTDANYYPLGVHSTQDSNPLQFWRKSLMVPNKATMWSYYILSWHWKNSGLWSLVLSYAKTCFLMNMFINEYAKEKCQNMFTPISQLLLRLYLFQIRQLSRAWRELSNHVWVPRLQGVLSPVLTYHFWFNLSRFCPYTWPANNRRTQHKDTTFWWCSKNGLHTEKRWCRTYP